MKLETKKWIKDGQFMVEIKGTLLPDGQSLIQKYGDMRIELSPYRAKKSFSKLSDFSGSGSFPNEEEAKTFTSNISKKLKEILRACRDLSGDFQDAEVHNIEGLELRVKREIRARNYVLHITAHPNEKSKELIEKYSDQDIDISSEKSTSHVQSFSPQSPKILSLRIDKSFENALDAYQYRDKIKTRLKQIMKDYVSRKDTFAGTEEEEI